MWIHNFVSYIKNRFLQPWGHPHIVWLLQLGALIPCLHMLPKTWKSTYNMSSWHYFRLAKQLIAFNRKIWNLKFKNLFRSEVRFQSWDPSHSVWPLHMVDSCLGFIGYNHTALFKSFYLQSSGSYDMIMHTHEGHLLMELQVLMQASSTYTYTQLYLQNILQCTSCNILQVPKKISHLSHFSSLHTNYAPLTISRSISDVLPHS